MTIPALPVLRTSIGDALVTADDVAEFLQVDRSTVFRLAGRKIPVVQIGRARRFRIADVLAFVERQTRETQGRSENGKRVLAAARNARPNELASPRRESVHAKHESCATAAGTAEAAR